MFLALEVVLILFAAQSIASVTTPLYDNFLTVPLPNVNTMFSTLKYYPSRTKNLLKFDGSNTAVDYTTNLWMEPCYQEFYNAKNASYVIFWLKNDVVYCEAGNYVLYPVTPTFTVDYLMRVERLGDRCTETM